jgi:hypothetical protein
LYKKKENRGKVAVVKYRQEWSRYLPLFIHRQTYDFQKKELHSALVAEIASVKVKYRVDIDK